METSFLWLLLIPFTAVFVIILFLTMVFEKTVEDRLRAIRSIYIYTVSLVSLCVFLFGAGNLVYTGLASTLFPKAQNENFIYRMQNCETYPAKIDPASTGTTLTTEDKQACLERETKSIAEEKEARFQSQMLTSIIMIFIGFPVYFIHFVVLRKRGG